MPTALRQRPSVLLFAAAVSALISIGTQWGSRVDMDYGWMPGFCVTAYDVDGWAYLDCSGAGYSYYDYNLESIPGYAMPARILIVLAVAAIGLGYATARRPHCPQAARRAVRWLQVGLVAAALAPVLNGLRMYAGQLAWWLALALVVIALHADRRWPFRDLRTVLRPAGRHRLSNTF